MQPVKSLYEYKKIAMLNVKGAGLIPAEDIRLAGVGKHPGDIPAVGSPAEDILRGHF